MKMSSLPLLKMSPPGAVISVNFCMRLGCVVGGCCCGAVAAAVCSGCAVGAGMTAGPARRAPEGDVLAMLEVPRVSVACVPATPPLPAGDCTVGVPVLPALVRAIVLAG